MQSTFAEMLKEGNKFWVAKLKKYSNADYKNGFAELFRYYNLTPEQEKQLAETLASFKSGSSTQASAEGSRSYAGDKGLVNLTINRNTPIEKKVVAEHSYGERIRIAKLFDNHVPYMDHII
jgi:hypothetical protein